MAKKTVLKPVKLDGSRLTLNADPACKEEYGYAVSLWVDDPARDRVVETKTADGVIVSRAEKKGGRKLNYARITIDLASIPPLAIRHDGKCSLKYEGCSIIFDEAEDLVNGLLGVAA